MNRAKWLPMLLLGLLLVLGFARLFPHVILSISTLTLLRSEGCPNQVGGWEDLRVCNREYRAASCELSTEGLQAGASYPAVSQLRLIRFVSLACENDRAVIERFQKDKAAQNPLLPVDVVYVSDAFERQGEATEALELRRAKPEMASWFISQAVNAIEHTGDERGAIALFAKAENVWPGLDRRKIAMYQYLCSFSARDGKSEVIPNPCESYAALDPSAKTSLLLGQFYYHKAMYVQAAAAFRDAIVFDPKTPSSYDWLTQALAATGDYAGALEAATSGIENAGYHSPLYFRLADLNIKVGCYNEAKEYLDAVLQGGPTDVETDTAKRLLETLPPVNTAAEKCK